ncbi:MAG: site-specific tyrosine recombinase XerD [Thermobacillus sp.]|uniref:tyrosine recombinase n=1 Tax=Thermobacillus sp. TaxID=2108467 RepID=UPI000E363400|nr:tyrosine recombinase [Thermobacillus sp.]REK57551.1 MAG: site-specific tyrosine recombinase XerD [Thermobacillus sp.]
MPDFPDLLERFLASRMESRSFSRSTADSYARDLKAFTAAMEAQGISDPGQVKPHHITAYLAGMRSEGKAPASIARAASSIRAFFRCLAADLKAIEADPAAHIRLPKPERKPPRILTEAEAVRLLETPDGCGPSGLRDRAMLELLYATGVRAGELIGLDVDDVNPSLGYVRCAGPDGRERFIPLGKASAEALERYLKDGRPHLVRPDRPERALFVSRRGSRLTRQGFWKLMKKHAETSGLGGVSPHMLRHAFAAHLVAGGADLRAVQEMLGHKDISATRAYAKMARPSLKSVYESAHPRAR